jgi:serine/threonine protein kinase
VRENEVGKTLKKVCPSCGKRIAGGRRSGSLTAYLFGESDCVCSQRAGRPKISLASSKSRPDEDSDFCPKCGLQIATESKDGSLTGFLFQSTRCKCPPDQAFADGKMSAKFWKLKQADSSTIFTTVVTEPSRGAPNSIGLVPGATIGGAYKIIELIGRGGMGEVYLARHETLGKKCALKVIPPEEVTSIGWQRFQLEARAVAKLDHVNLVRVTDLGIHDGCLPFYAMDYVEGKNLAELLAERGPIPLITMLEIFMQVCDGVECAHRSGILHRDLKPANIMVATTRSGTTQAKVLDFGLAKLTGHDRNKQSLTAVGDVFGSPFYMSPEQCNGDKLDDRSDIYSLGCTMFECLTGRPPFAGDLATTVFFGHLEADPPSLETIVGPGRYPASMEIVLAKLLRKNPVERYQTLVELRGDLEKVAHGGDVQPFYVSRSRPLFEMDTVAEADPTVPDHTRGLLILSICSLAVAVSVYIAWAALPSIFAVPRSQNVTLLSSIPITNSDAVTGLRDSPSELAHARQVFENCGPISDGVVVRGGAQVRMFHFPVVPLGFVEWGSSGHSTLARGTVGVPASELITLKLPAAKGLYARKFPEVLAKIGPDDIYALEVTQSIDSGMEDLLSSELSVRLVKAVSKWRALRKISFYRCRISEDALFVLNYLSSHIEELNLRQSNLDGKHLARVRWLTGLKVLDANGIVNIDAVLKAMAGSSSLNTLVLDSTSPSKVGIQALSTCPNLQTLDLSETGMDDQKLAAVCNISSLRNLNLRRCIFHEKSLHRLSKLPKLTRLYLDSQEISEAEVNVLRHEMPRCSIDVVVNKTRRATDE